MTRNKQQLTETLVELTQDTVSLDQALLSWYYNIRPSGGMRLTETGYQALQFLDIESWQVPIPNIKSVLDKRMLLDLDRQLQWPYYIDFKKKYLIFFSSKEAMMATLYGDLTNWVKSL
jgi:hypothetical protein